jgi:hypothetical protein
MSQNHDSPIRLAIERAIDDLTNFQVRVRLVRPDDIDDQANDADDAQQDHDDRRRRGSPRHVGGDSFEQRRCAAAGEQADRRSQMLGDTSARSVRIPLQRNVRVLPPFLPPTGYAVRLPVWTSAAHSSNRQGFAGGKASLQ